MEFKVCSICKDEKEITAFYPRMGRCKSCHNVKVVLWQRNNRDKTRAIKDRWRSKPDSREKELAASQKWNEANILYRRITRVIRNLHKHGLTLNSWLDLHIQQNFVCAICKKRTERGLDVDHNHITGKFRTLLCIPCNTVIGLVKESPKTLSNIAEYLSAHK